jgi:energy-coupling factor transporter ATP-binding protein EcfA2
MKDHQRYSPSYRAVETRQVMDWIRAGQCGCIVGLRGSGKSNFIRFLLRADTQQHYLGQEQVNFTFALVNLLSLTERSEWGVYEMMLNNLLAQLHPPDMADGMILEVKTLHQEMMRVHDVLTAERAVERCMALLCQQPTRRLVLLFDEFDAVFRDLPASLFRCLRAMRDASKDQISYIVAATHDLADLRHDLAEGADHFYRLVSRNSCWLGPYCEADARQMAGYLASRRNLELSEKDATRLFELSGGHASLLKTILGLLWNGDNPGGLEKPAATLATPSRRPFEKESAIERECQKLWDSLSENEKAALCSFSNDDPLDERALNHLIERGLLRQSGNNAQTIFSPLLASFVREQAPPPQKGTYVSRSPRVVQLDGKRIKHLTELEFELLFYLYEHHGQVCTKNDLIAKVYQQRYDATSDEMLQALILRLRKKIEPDFQHPRYISTIRGEGYKFILPNEQQ